MVKVLFVCLGNICRSPAAEAIMKALVEKYQSADKIFCDSAGTASYHEGQKADERMINAAKMRGYDVTSISRPVFEKDFENFDYIIAMDNTNYAHLVGMSLPEKIPNIYRMIEFAPSFLELGIPDPYFGGENGFFYVIDILEEACQNLFDKIKNAHFQD